MFSHPHNSRTGIPPSPMRQRGRNQNIYIICKIFFLFCVICSFLDGVSFTGQKFLIWWSSISCFVLVTYAFRTISKKSVVNPRFQRFTPMFCKSFIVLILTFRSMIHLEQIFVCGARNGFSFILLHVAIWLVSTVCWKEYFSSLNYHGTPVKNCPLPVLGTVSGKQFPGSWSRIERCWLSY